MNDPELDSLIRRSRAGDRGAFDEIAGRLRPWLERVATRYVADDASDLVQTALLRAYEQIGRYDEARSFSTWLFHILRNACFNHARHRRRPAPPDAAAAPRAPEAQSAERELLGRVGALVAGLPGDLRELVRLRFAEGLAHREIARTLGISEANVRVKLYRALQRLRGGLGDVL